MAVGAALVALAGLGADPALASALVLLGAGVVAQASFWMARNGSETRVRLESEAAASEAAT
jgi:DHA1 family bicyclomycin/chloramphenicol resistance-like MFS transporter